MEKKLDLILKQLTELNGRQGKTEHQLGRIGKRFDGLEGHFNGLEGHFDSLEGRFDGMERRQDRMERQINHIQQDVTDVKGTVHRIEHNQEETVIAMLKHVKKQVDNKAHNIK